MTVAKAASWRRGIDYYTNLAEERATEGAAIRLGCLVLASFCIHEWSGDCGGPTPDMVQLAEQIVGDCLDSVIASAALLKG